ncbi:putative ABC transporter permease [Anaerosphaera multitolerans]|uniref:putative ABC transporter permease n=1 Tax=Anaerosphaera multitolerans TaxID=2487351 RepID=UPI0013E31120|nr:putative ABC transporter permease [Anaerosphaera multitolerans]
MSLTFIQYLFLFFIFSFLGWAVEVLFIFIVHNRYVNTGTLNGPICPIYGFGLLFVLKFIYGLNNVFLIFLGSALIATVVELIGGLLLYQILHKRWWDYSNIPFNYKGYICLRYSLFWGLGGTFVCYFLMPVILKLNSLLWNLTYLYYALTFAFTTVFIIDVVSSFLSIFKLRSKYAEINNIARELRHLGDEISRRLVDNVPDLDINKEELKFEYLRIKEKYKNLLERELPKEKRFFDKFPNLGINNILKEVSQKLKDDFNEN